MVRKQKVTAVAIIIIAVVLVQVMVAVNKKRSPKKPTNVAVAVRVEHVVPSDVQAKIQSTATVTANQTLNLSPEVAGKVRWISPKLRAGGVVKKGALLVKIDDADYKLALEQIRVSVNRAQLEIDQESARGDVAQKEWNILGDSSKPSDLVLRVQQGKVAKLNLLSAESALKKAKLNLQRTEIRAPFTAYISQSRVAVGQYVSPQVMVARLLEKRNLTAEVAISLDELKWVEIPGINGSKKGSKVVVKLAIGTGEYVERDGRVEALIGEVDQSTRRARLRVSLEDTKAGEIPLLPGSFVDVTIYGKRLTMGYEIPREALVDTRSIFVVTSENKLKQVAITRAWGTKEKIISQLDGQDSGIDVLVSHPQGAVTGLAVRPISNDNSQEK